MVQIQLSEDETHSFRLLHAALRFLDRFPPPPLAAVAARFSPFAAASSARSPMSDRQHAPPPAGPASLAPPASGNPNASPTPPPPPAPTSSAAAAVPASGNPNPTPIPHPPPAPTPSAAGPAHSPPPASGIPNPTPISSRLENVISTELTSRFGTQQAECRGLIQQIKQALIAKGKMLPDLDALFHQGHQLHDPEKQLQLMASILDPAKLSVLLQILQSDPGTPDATVESPPAASWSPPLAADNSPEPSQPAAGNLIPPAAGRTRLPAAGRTRLPAADNSSEPIVGNETETVAGDPVQSPAVEATGNPLQPPAGSPLQPPAGSPVQPPVVDPQPVIGGENQQQGANVVGNNQQAVNVVGNQQQGANVVGNNQQAVNVVGNQQQAVNANEYDGYEIHRLTREGFNKFTVRFKAIKDLTLREYICILRNRVDFDGRETPMPDLREGVILYHVPPGLNLDRVVSDGGADGQQWNLQRSYSRQIMQERIRYTSYQCEADTRWTKKVYRTSSVDDWVVIHYQFSGDMPTVKAMVSRINRLQESFDQFRAQDNNICGQMVEALQPT